MSDPTIAVAPVLGLACSHAVTVLAFAPPELAFCPSHPSDVTAYYCAAHNALVCAKCAMPGQPHAGEAPGLVGECVAAISERMARVVAASVAGAASSVAQADAAAAAVLALDCVVAEQVRAYVQHVDDSVARFTTAAHARRDAVLAEVLHRQKACAKALEAAGSVCRVGAGQLTVGVAVCEAARSSGNPVTMTSTLASLERMSGLCYPAPPRTLDVKLTHNVDELLAAVPACSVLRLDVKDVGVRSG